MVDWIVDLAGNEIDYTYTKASNRVYLDTISWGPPDNGGSAYSVAVDYEARPDVGRELSDRLPDHDRVAPERDRFQVGRR